MAAMQHDHIHSHIGKATDAKLRQFCSMIQDLQDQADNIPHAQLFESLLERSHYLGYLREQTLIKHRQKNALITVIICKNGYKKWWHRC